MVAEAGTLPSVPAARPADRPFAGLARKPWKAYGILTAVAVFSVFPLFWMLTTAFTPNDLVLTRAFRFLPEQPSFINFVDAFTRNPVFDWLINSITVATLVTVGKLLIAVPAGFAFAHMEFRGRKVLFWVILATMTFPTDIGIVPLYVGVSVIGWYDTLAGVIVPSIAYIGFYVFFMRQNFRNLPAAMFEAARVDGAGPLRQFLQIALPNVLPAVASISVISFMGAWNIYLWSLLVLDSPEKRTLAVGIKAFSSIDEYEPLWGPMMATGLVSILPVLILFIGAQKFILAAFTGGVND